MDRLSRVVEFFPRKTVVSLSRHYSQKKSMKAPRILKFFTFGRLKSLAYTPGNTCLLAAQNGKVFFMVTSTDILQETGSLKGEFVLLSLLVEKLKLATSLNEKVEILNAFPRVEEFLCQPSILRSFLGGVSKEFELVIKAVIAIDQGERVFNFPARDPAAFQKLHALVEELLAVEHFYREVGGIVGYHFLMLRCMFESETPATLPLTANYHAPEGIDISEETKEVREAIVIGIEKIAEMAEIYPVGGAADRLNLQDMRTGIPLPAAKLPFGGMTLLEGMIRDLQAREYLHYKLFGKQLCTPVVMMTSQEKDNHAQILSICETHSWFGRPKNSFRFFSQPAVPSMNTKGQWCMQGPLQLLMKPGGHGVIWKLARDSKTFEWLMSQGKKKALVRQINNPIAGTDYGLLAFTGFGCKEDKVFGFASCPRKVGAMEGINVLLERKMEESVEYVLTNIEYCDFHKCRLVDQTEKKDPEHSKFSSNTNILFVDLLGVSRAVDACPFPGVVINPKKVVYRKEDTLVEEEVARLESTMQNIADCFVQSFPRPLPKGRRKQEFNTFLTFNQRRKTISTVKREFAAGSSLNETPEGCFLDMMENARQLLIEGCKMEFIKSPKTVPFPFLFSYHPALGPLYSVITQKVRGGRITSGSELRLELTEADVVNLDLDGSLSIIAKSPLGHCDSKGVLAYSEKVGKCVLNNVRVRNLGIDWQGKHTFWKKEIIRTEECRISILGSGEFYAEDVTFNGPMNIEVEDGMRLTAKMLGGKLTFTQESISKPSWFWNYSLTEDFRIVLKK